MHPPAGRGILKYVPFLSSNNEKRRPNNGRCENQQHFVHTIWNVAWSEILMQFLK